MTFFTIAAVQIPVPANADNMANMRQQLDATVKRFPSVKMIIFSELCAMGPSKSHAQSQGGSIEKAFCEMAATYKIWLIPGSIYEQDGEHIYNTSPVINPDGIIVTRYRKMFPFLPYETGVSAGNEFCIFDVPDVGRFGVSICYDKWFPETTRTLALMGAEVILQPTMTDTIDRGIELIIARTNAAINQCYFIDVNGIGECGNGQSIIVGPAGDIIHQAGVGREIIPVELDFTRVRRERQRGLMQLGQPLKSYRDRPIDFSQAQDSVEINQYLNSLGEIQKPS